MTKADNEPREFAHEEVLDALGLKCPLPVLKTRRALSRLGAGATLVVIATDPMSAIDIPHLVREMGEDLVGASEEDGVLRFVIRGRGAPA